MTNPKGKVLAENKSSDQEIIRWTESREVLARLKQGVSDVVEDHGDLDKVFREAIFQDNTACALLQGLDLCLRCDHSRAKPN